MVKISVIVPVFKVEKYIIDCIKSILSQSFRDFQLILVDDGSPDRSGEICDKFALKDNRVSVIHKKNQGVSSARNCGITNALGEWICFVDSDDTIDCGYLENLYLGVKHNSNIDFAISGYRNVDGNLVELSTHKFESNLDSSDLYQLFLLSEKNNTLNSPVCKLFKKDIIIKNNLEFDSSLSYGEDHIFVLDYFKYIKSYYISNCADYNYFHRSNNNSSLTNSACNAEKMILYVEQVKKRYEVLRTLLISKKYSDVYNHQLHDHLIRATYHLFVSHSTSKWNLFRRICILCNGIESKLPTSPFYKLIWSCLKLPKLLSFCILLVVCRVKHLLVS